MFIYLWVMSSVVQNSFDDILPYLKDMSGVMVWKRA